MSAPVRGLHDSGSYKPASSPTPPGNGITWRSYYYAGSTRVAMREQTISMNVVYYLHADHLGSASLATVLGGAKVTDSDTRYKPFGEIRSGGSTLPTDRRFTGQRAEASLGLYNYGARFYDSCHAS